MAISLLAHEDVCVWLELEILHCQGIVQHVMHNEALH